MRLYPVLVLLAEATVSGSDARAQDRAMVIACWQQGATNMMLMEMCSGSWIPPDLLMSCLCGGPCGASPPSAGGQDCGAPGLQACPVPQPCGRPFPPWTIACIPPAPIWAPACGAPPFPPCIAPQVCGLPGTFPCEPPPPLDSDVPTEDFEAFLEIEPTIAMTLPGDSVLSPDDDQVGLFFAAPPMPDVDALQSCYDTSATEDDFYDCVTQEALPDDYRQVPACVADYAGDPARQALCSLGNDDATEAYETFVEVQDCIDQAGEDEYDVAYCLGEPFLGENERYYLRCVTENRGDLYLAGACAVAKDLNPEQQIALACAMQTGGNPKAFAICTGGQLTARELSKCWEHGIATNDGCFGPNNEFRRVADRVRDEVCNATGDNSVVCDTYDFWHDNVLMPGTPAMAAVIDATPADRMMILTNAKGGPLTGRHANEMLRYYRDKAGLTEEGLGYALRLQDCRGTAATRLLNADLSLAEIASHMGWSVRFAAAVIEHYARVSPDETDGILLKLAFARGGAA